jgi:serine/threonine-protein kinase RsbW
MIGRMASRPHGSQGGMASEPWRERLRNQMSAVGGAQKSFEAFLEARSVDAETTFRAVLALEEAVTNVIKYACDDGREHAVLLEARLAPAELVLVVSDDGRAFDPCVAPPPDRQRPAEERAPGGLGIHLLRKLTVRMHYERSGEWNRLTLVFALAPRS